MTNLSYWRMYENNRQRWEELEEKFWHGNTFTDTEQREMIELRTWLNVEENEMNIEESRRILYDMEKELERRAT
jgi:hypothetical protein